MIDNSLSDLSFAFLDGGVSAAAAIAPSAAVETKTGEEKPPGRSGAADSQAARADLRAREGSCADEEVAADRSTAGADTISAPRRYAWGALYALRSMMLALVVVCVGSLVCTMVLNPELTFDETLRFIFEQVMQAAKRIGAIFT